MIEIGHHRVLIDGRPLPEPYLRSGRSMWEVGPVLIEHGPYFMMGDSRNLSSDCRCWGTVSEDRMIGAVGWIVWPPSRLGRR